MYCSDIITFNTIADKGAIRDVGRALEIPLDEVDEICKAFESNEEKLRKKYPELFKYVDLVKGVIVSVGSHPCGCIVSPETLTDNVATFTTSTSKYPISQIYMKEVDGLNYVKLDLLRLDTIELINDTCKLAGIPRLTPDNVDINDVAVWNSMRDDSTGIFQWESDTGADYIKKLLSDENIKKFQAVDEHVDRMTLLTIGNSAIRPAGASYRDDLANGVVRKSGSQVIDDFLKPTFGYLVFQCQIIEFLHQYCGFTMGEADIVRRCVDENTEILMGDGTRKKIKDILPGEEVISFDEGFSQPKRVNKVFDNGTSPVCEIATMHGYKLRATKSHKILTQRGWVECGSLTTNDYVMVPKRINCNTDLRAPNKRLSCTDMFLIGALIGDGTLGKGESGLCFTNSDEVLIEEFKNCVRQRITHGDGNVEFSVCSQPGVEVEQIYSVRIKSKNYRKSVYDVLKKYGLNVPAAQKHIPSELLSYPLGSKFYSLLGGLFSTDAGYVEQALSIEYSTISKELAWDVKNMLLKCGIYSYISTSLVKGYGYSSYKVIASQRDSLIKFKSLILPFMHGKKVEQFSSIIDRNTMSEASFNYIVPGDYIDEMYAMSKKSKVSFNSFGNGGIHSQNGFTDIKSRQVVEHIYCPKTYALLMSDLQPLKIKSISDTGVSHVYDLEVEGTHNYVADGMVVHNCFAKKLGTENHIPVIKNGGYMIGLDGEPKKDHYIAGFTETMKKNYGMSPEESEKTIAAFLQVIIDASNYLFSLNHSQPYSYEGYVSGWLRYHYPVEFITTALNINVDKEEKTLALTRYAKAHGIQILPPKFRHSKAVYFCNAESREIYKGIGSIKFMNAQVADELYALKDEQFEDFIDLLAAVKKTSCNSRQLQILIELDYFSEFGDVNFLLTINNLFGEVYGKQQIKKDKIPKLGEYITEMDVRQFAGKESEKTFTKVDTFRLLKYLAATIQVPPATIMERISYQKENLGYVDIVDKKYAGLALVMSINTKWTPWLTLYALANGKTIECKVDKRDYNRQPVKEGDVIRIEGQTYKNKQRKTENGFEVVPGSKVLWITKYGKVVV